MNADRDELLREAVKDLKPAERTAVLRFARLARKYPDTSAANILGRITALQRRRAKNHVAKASRKRNRRSRA